MPADEGVERSAILLIALGEDYASEVLKHLGPKEVQKLGHAMAALKTVPRAKVEEVLSDFHKTATESAAVRWLENIASLISGCEPLSGYSCAPATRMQNASHVDVISFLSIPL